MKNSNIELVTHRFNPWEEINDNRVLAPESIWEEPLKWNRQAKEAGERHRVFCASLADVFEDWQGPMTDVRGGTWSTAQNGHWWNYQHETTDDDWGVRDLTMQDVRERLFDLIDRTPNLDWLLLTKRPENIAKMMPPRDLGEPDQEDFRTGMDPEAPWRRENLWIGTSLENQQTADERIPHLLKVPAAVRFLSAEPLLGPVDIWESMRQVLGKGAGAAMQMGIRNGIDLVIVGGESGPKARPCNIDWIRSIVRQCQAAGVPVFVKQLGSNPGDASRMSMNPRIHLNDPKGGDPEDWPEDLRVRDLPNV